MQWDPWRGCHRCSTGCRFCYIHKGDAKRGVVTDQIIKTAGFDKPRLQNKKGEYKWASGKLVYVCFRSDFLLAEADAWRMEAYAMMKARPDLQFLFLTKRIERFREVLPDDWGTGYPNITVGVSIEDQDNADRRLKILKDLPIQHKNIICQPLIGPVDLSEYLTGIELVVVGGEADLQARPLDYAWVLAIREQCVKAKVAFQFRQCGTNFIRDGVHYRIPVRQLTSQARKAGIAYQPDSGD